MILYACYMGTFFLSNNEAARVSQFPAFQGPPLEEEVKELSIYTVLSQKCVSVIGFTISSHCFILSISSSEQERVYPNDTHSFIHHVSDPSN